MAAFEGKVQPYAGIAETWINGWLAYAQPAGNVSRKQNSPC
jgi:hypothetical protein